MVVKCCVTLCKGNYASSSKRLPVYKLPQYEKEKKKWISVIPRANLVVSKYRYTAVCGKHWPNNAEMVKFHGKLRPKNPFSVFPGIPSKLSVLSIKKFSQSICSPEAMNICDAWMVFHQSFGKGDWKIMRRFRRNLLYNGIGCY